MNFVWLVLLSSSVLCGQAANWSELIEQYRGVMGEQSYALILRQYKVYAEGKATAIAHPCIKEIPIVECGEPSVDIVHSYHDRIRTMEGDELLQAHTYPEDIDPRAACYSMMRRGTYEALVCMIAELDYLAPSFGYEAGALELRLFEGLRDLATQKELFDMKMAAIIKQHPEMTEEQAYAETSQWVSPYKNNVPTHSTGGAVDIHLFNSTTKTFCDMGRFNTGGALAPTFSPDERLTDEQRRHRLLFMIAATRAGLTNYLYEFWHFSYGDRYAAYWHSEGAARYGSL